MKKILLAFGLLLVLVGCAIEDSPENYFMMALTEVEESTNYQTYLTLKEGNEELVKINYEKKSEKDESVSVELVEEQQVKHIKVPLVTLQYSMIFSNFSKDENIITCDIKPENSEVLCNLISLFTTEPIETITHKMYLDNYSIDYIVMEINTANHSYECTIIVEN